MSKTTSFFKHAVTVNKPKDIVFKALTQADELIRWFPSRAESDPKPGGAFKLFWDFTEASQNGSQEGRYIEVVPGEKVSYTWMVTEGAVPTLVTILLKETDGGTTLELDHSTTHAGADEKKLHDGHANQWGFFLMNLKGYLEAGKDLRKEKLNQITH
jgi:uncharacterized protein YndB with AHSA1/START domain